MKFYFGDPLGTGEGTNGQWHASVVCRLCQAQGPLCHAELRKDATEKAISMWNKRNNLAG